ncbi:MAG: type II secretion system F family protein, partial [Chloroflexi bacterium]|nr:type II secretion system F family protein [Chloroflexota bacterium]
PKQMQQRMEEALNKAGNPVSMNTYLALRGLGMFGLPLLYVLFALSLHASFGIVQIGMLLLFGYIGGFIPKRWVSAAAEKRQKAIERALPDALDLIVVSMEAGLALDGAIAKVVEKTTGPLKQEFQKTLHEIQLGKPRRDALRQLGHRTKVKQLIALVNAIVQADQMGVAMAQVMRTQADEARIKRRQRAEEKAHQAAVKMLFPLVLFILPCVMVVTVGPAAIEIYRQFASGLLG